MCLLCSRFVWTLLGFACETSLADARLGCVVPVLLLVVMFALKNTAAHCPVVET